eukprot:3602624-Amphidinium_carterae.1
MIQAQRGPTVRVDTIENLVKDRTQQTIATVEKVDKLALELNKNKLQWQTSVAELRARLARKMRAYCYGEWLC